MAQWAGLSHTAQWDQTECFPRVILIGQWLMAQWASHLILGPVGPRRMFSLDEINQPVSVGPVGHPFTPGPVGTQARVSKLNVWIKETIAQWARPVN